MTNSNDSRPTSGRGGARPGAGRKKGSGGRAPSLNGPYDKIVQLRTSQALHAAVEAAAKEIGVNTSAFYREGARRYIDLLKSKAR